MARPGPKPKATGVQQASKDRRARRTAWAAKAHIRSITQHMLKLPVKYPLRNCSDFVCNAAACKRLAAGIRQWSESRLICLALCFLVTHTLRSPAAVATFVASTRNEFHKGCPFVLLIKIRTVLAQQKFRRSCYWTGMVALSSFEPHHLAKRFSGATIFVTAKTMSDLVLGKTNSHHVLQSIRDLPHVGLYGFDIFRHWVRVVELVCKLRFKRGVTDGDAVTRAAAAMTKHVGIVYDCVLTASGARSPIDASVLSCEVYAFLSALKLVPVMKLADLANADIVGLAKLVDCLRATGLEPIQDHSEQSEVNKHFSAEVRQLGLQHTSVPLKSYSKQCKQLLDRSRQESNLREQGPG